MYIYCLNSLQNKALESVILAAVKLILTRSEFSLLSLSHKYLSIPASGILGIHHGPLI